jgi:RHH-type proline utilization regulon transcriptional repressor/proline dehydrogenase/delta 1-pyrroline-5-carboxylate dehydrogenase
MAAIHAVGESAGPNPSSHPDSLLARPGLSVKLSALHPRYEPGKEARLDVELFPRLMTLLRAAEGHGLAVTIDAEEQDRHELMLDMFGRAFVDPSLDRWTGLGIAVQAYGKRAIPTIRWLRRLAEATGKRIPLRLVKGAYWDSEVKWAQERGLSDYPVLTRKLHTDVSYLACMRLILSDSKAFYPQIATHNAHTAASALVAAGQTAFEFQRLHGMGEALYEEVSAPGKLGRPCRIYAPVGEHEDLLSYLVRRLLENGANTSFVNRLADNEAPITRIIRDPVETAERERLAPASMKALPRPRDIYWPERKNSFGVALTDRTARAALLSEMETALARGFDAGPIVDGIEYVSGPQAALVVVIDVVLGTTLGRVAQGLH